MESQGRTCRAVRTEQDELIRLKRENEALRKEWDFFQSVRRRVSQGYPHEVLRDPGVRPSLSDPAHVPRPVLMHRSDPQRGALLTHSAVEIGLVPLLSILPQ